MRRAACLAVLTAALAFAGPAAAAERGHYVVPAGHLTRFELSGSNGYRVVVSVNPRGVVMVGTSKGPATTEYITRDRSAGEFGAAAKLPGLGTVAFGFTPNRRERRTAPDPACGGVRETVQDGVAHGLIRFRGERGYTTVDRRRVRAEVRSWPRHKCRFLDPSQGTNRLDAFFYALSPSSTLTEFSAFRFVEGARPWSRRIEFNAGTSSFDKGMAIFRTVAVAAAPETFQQPDPAKAPERLVLQPPAPFSGSGRLERTAESTFTWSGSLKVRFPGLDPLMLSSSKFATSFCADRGCAAQIPEDFLRGLS